MVNPPRFDYDRHEVKQEAPGQGKGKKAPAPPLPADLVVPKTVAQKTTKYALGQYLGSFDLCFQCPDGSSVTLPDRTLRLWKDWLQVQCNERLTNLNTTDSGYSVLEIDVHSAGKKVTMSATKVSANLGLNFIGTISMDWRPGSIKLGDLFGSPSFFNLLLPSRTTMLAFAQAVCPCGNTRETRWPKANSTLDVS